MDLDDLRISSTAPVPVSRKSILERLRQTAVAAVSALLGIPAIVLFVLSVVGLPLVVVGVGLVLLLVAVPGTALLTRSHRLLSGAVLGEVIAVEYADAGATPGPGRPFVWLRDRERWRDAGFLAFSATVGAALSWLPVVLLIDPFVFLVLSVADGGAIWLLLILLGIPLVALWWYSTPTLVRARALADRRLLGTPRVEQLARRVEEVAASRSETMDHSAAEVRRIERDLHDGAQARIVSLGMHLGLAEELLKRDPDAAVALLRDARQSTVSALSDLRDVIRGIHPPVLADRGLVGAVEALAIDLPVPVMITVSMAGPPPPPVESAVYFAIAECLANTVKHSLAARAWVSIDHRNGVLRVECGDDGHGGADRSSSGLTGMSRRLAAFDGTMSVESPEGGPTVVVMEVPCSLGENPSALSSPRT
jgi:signal transduction histidine kinase